MDLSQRTKFDESLIYFFENFGSVKILAPQINRLVSIW